MGLSLSDDDIAALEARTEVPEPSNVVLARTQLNGCGFPVRRISKPWPEEAPKTPRT